MKVKCTQRKRVLAMLVAVLLLTGGILFTENASACTLPPNTYAYPGECILYNMDGTKYEEPQPSPQLEEELQMENQDRRPRHSYRNNVWTPFSYRYGHHPFWHHDYLRYGSGLHFGLGHRFGHHRSHH